MTKNEIIEAINATIIPNGQKGITAESLANLLIEMVNATPEGGSEGGGAYILKTREADDFSDLTDEDKANNAIIYNKVMSGNLDGVVILDFAPLACRFTAQCVLITGDSMDVVECDFLFPVAIDSEGFAMSLLLPLWIYADGSIEIRE